MTFLQENDTTVSGETLFPLTEVAIAHHLQEN